MIKPTVGRVVWFHQEHRESSLSGPPLAAIVTAVHSDYCVNLCVFSDGGAPMGYSSVPLHQEGDEFPSGFYCEWMPYQKGQAAKTEALESELEANTEVSPEPTL